MTCAVEIKGAALIDRKFAIVYHLICPVRLTVRPTALQAVDASSTLAQGTMLVSKNEDNIHERLANLKANMGW